MTNANSLEDDDKPLDAAQLRLQAKLKRLLFWSSGVMVLGLVAVFAAIFYRVTRVDGKPTPAFDVPIIAEVAMPEGGRVAATRLDGNRMTVTLETPKGAAILVLDLETMKVIRRLELTGPR
ncbi:hypothetical protein EYW49_16755 [Siculibacillus lacustris]|uniref:Fimbrial protein n=1 Tax=Siculibacillus lacustris TaxID=1549641 RepID=A0A4Q9VJS0_9HYPH|nr:DUF6476 family protein [Siculibacillus lacustris]TBW35100.1 hypothetical protein EYW49_16755 [Siculibacillus lacustris]